MALSHLLDTSVYCQPIKPRPLEWVRERWTDLGDDALAISSICEAGVLYGLELKKSQLLTALYEGLLKERLRVLPVDSGVVKHFASLKAWAKANGRALSDFDLLVAATARAHDLTLATLNLRHFQGLPSLTVEDWSQT
ncbi:MAG: type II toxin-antitoxin system VapC family toxin [Verrucomicrobia subdivision 3 bacterium]|nr:type II toxin-antitoxin system VapC family toxin [Limisphaerales bacterium]